MIHGTADTVLPPSCSEFISRYARDPKRLILYEGAGHSLEEVADEVCREVKAWVVGQLKGSGG